MIEKAWIDDLLIHDITNPRLGTALGETDLDSGPSPTVKTENRPRTHGSRNTTRWYGPRTFSIAGYAHGRDDADTNSLVDALKRGFTLGDQLHELRFKRRGQPTEELLGVVAAGAFEAPAKGYRPIVRWAIALEAPDPRVYGVELKTLVLDPLGGAIGQGLIFLVDWNLSFAGSGDIAISEPTILVGGSIGTPPIFTFQGPGRPTAISNETTGEKIQLVPTTFDATDVVEIDCRTRSCLYYPDGLDGAVFDRPELIDAAPSIWFDLEPGEQTLRLEGTDFVQGQTTLTIAYRDARG